MKVSLFIVFTVCTLIAIIQSCDSDNGVKAPCEPESQQSTYIVLYYKDHPSCFHFNYDLEVELDDGVNFRYWMPGIIGDPNIDYPNSPPLAVNRNQGVDVRFTYSDKNPQIGPTTGSFTVNTEDHPVIYISFFADTTSPCGMFGEMCDSLVAFEIDEVMKCEGADSIFVSWVY